ncbi:MAG: hypothetical protein WCO57_12715, partial [Verrucomicrobiota bacterium]
VGPDRRDACPPAKLPVLGALVTTRGGKIRILTNVPTGGSTLRRRVGDNAGGASASAHGHLITQAAF